MDLSQQKQDHPEKAERLAKMEKTTKRAEMIIDLQEHDGVRILLEELDSRIQAINQKMLYNVDMTMEERKVLITERSCWAWFIEQFDIARQAICNVEEYIKKL